MICSAVSLMLCSRCRPIRCRVFLPPVTTNKTRQSRDSWMAPGKVMVEDGLENFPPLAGNALLRMPPLPQAGLTAPSDHYFEPQAPTEIQRTARRLPAIEDFPPQAQKEWNAHHGASGEAWQSRCRKPQETGLFWTFDRLRTKISGAEIIVSCEPIAHIEHGRSRC